MKKYMKLTAAMLAAAMALSLTACGGGAGSSGSTATDSGSAATSATGEEAALGGEEVTIKFANYALLESGYTEFWEGVKTGFEEKYPNITIEWVTAPYGEIVNQVINQAGGGDMPDMMFGESTWVPTLVDAGLAIPVSEVFDEEYLSKFDQNALESCMMDGEVCGLPMYDCAFMLFYNKDLFEQAGLDPNTPPTTYDEMLDLATLGAGVLHNRSVELAKKYGVPLVVRSSLNNNEGTVVKEEVTVERMLISGVALDTDAVRIAVIGLKDVPGMAFKLFDVLARKHINVDVILQSIGRENSKEPALLRSFLETLGDCVVVVDDDEIIKVHVHTNVPGTVLTEALTYGPLLKVKIENMREQHSEMAGGEAAHAAAPRKALTATPSRRWKALYII